VEYGFNASYGFSSTLDPVLILNHQVAIALPPPGSKSSTLSQSPSDLEVVGRRTEGARSLPSEMSSAKGEKTEVSYHYRVLSEDSFGNLGVSGDNTFTVSVTAVDSTPPQIMNLEVSMVTDTSAQVGWETDEPASAVFNYGLAADDYVWSIEDTSMTIMHQFDLMGLSPATEYHFQARSADQTGNWAIYPDTTLMTRHPLPGQPGKPQHYDD
jgi:hypothetical protein